MEKHGYKPEGCVLQDVKSGINWKLFKTECGWNREMVMIEDDPRPNREEAIEAICNNIIGFDAAKPGSDVVVRTLVSVGTAFENGKRSLLWIQREPKK